MSKLYTAYVSGSDVHHWIDEGDPLTVEATPMVRLSHGAIVPASGWVASKKDAMLVAARKIDALAIKLIEKAAKLRQQATEAADAKTV